MINRSENENIERALVNPKQKIQPACEDPEKKTTQQKPLIVSVLINAGIIIIFIWNLRFFITGL